MYLAKTLTLRSLPEIGRRFGGRDHTTVLHAVRKIEGLVQGDKVLAEEIEVLKRLLAGVSPCLKRAALAGRNADGRGPASRKARIARSRFLNRIVPS